MNGSKENGQKQQNNAIGTIGLRGRMKERGRQTKNRSNQKKRLETVSRYPRMDTNIEILQRKEEGGTSTTDE